MCAPAHSKRDSDKGSSSKISSMLALTGEQLLSLSEYLIYELPNNESRDSSVSLFGESTTD